MAYIYASAVGTCVIQHRHTPRRPLEFNGVLLAFGLPDEVGEDDLREAINVGSRKVQRNDISQSVIIEIIKPRAKDGDRQLLWGGGANVKVSQDWELRFCSHEEARSFVAPLRQWANQLSSSAYVCFAYNDRPYKERGWVRFKHSNMCSTIHVLSHLTLASQRSNPFRDAVRDRGGIGP